ncbi:MAG: pseudaminic acid cytidylyltransferase [Deltaproteobacteria bacterium]|nr:pseudaminic acid cytidylyltransferase [Deltaproteobacteria bacterium]
MNIAVIPARGGSKRIPRKNIKAFCGKPMIAWSIERALESRLFERVIVSTDDDEIASVASEYGALVPFRRPAHLSDDRTPTAPVIVHAIKFCEETLAEVSHACCIYPCAPFLQATDLSASLVMLKEKNADFIYPVTPYPHPVQRALKMTQDGRMQFLHPEFELTNTQNLDTLYHDTGQFYWGKVSAWLADKKMHSGGIGFPVPGWRVVDIDNMDDWMRAELIQKAIREQLSLLG